MKTIKYTPLIILILFVLCCLSCKDEFMIEESPLCCLSLPGMLSLHIADIEGVGTSEKERKDFLGWTMRPKLPIWTSKNLPKFWATTILRICFSMLAL